MEKNDIPGGKKAEDFPAAPTDPSDIDNDSLFRLVDNLPGMAYRCKNDTAWTMIYVSRGAKELLGYEPDDMIRNARISYNDVIYFNDRQSVWNSVQSAVKEKKRFEMVYRVVTASGGIKWVYEKGNGVYDQKGDLISLEGYIVDNTEPVEIEEALKEKEAFLSSIIENIPDMIFIKDAGDLRFIRFNKAGEALLGMDANELIGKTDYDLFPRKQADFFTQKDREVLSRGTVCDIPEEIINTKDRRRTLHTKKIPITDDRGTPIYLLGISEDITQIKKDEEDRENMKRRLALTQKMDSIGLLAGGIAHDFNNMLGAILGYTELSLAALDPDNPLYGNLMGIQKAALQSSDLTKQLLAFSRQQTSSPVVLDINQTIEHMLKLLKRLIREDITLRWVPGDNVPRVEIDSVQINQILSNLCINARDAIIGCGTITIETSSVAVDDSLRTKYPDLVSDAYTILSVSDDGVGISKENMDRIFDPFFTTKEIGKGTGLGLSTVYGIVKQNMGSIMAYSEPGNGTTFRIYLPATAGDESGENAESVSEIPRGNETLLLIEDEPILLEMTKTMMESLGYTVLASKSPLDGIALAKTYTGKIHLLMTDVIMPGMNGKDLARSIGFFLPDVKYLFVSGYTRNIILDDEKWDRDFNFVQKPYSLRDIGRKIRDILDSA